VSILSSIILPKLEKELLDMKPEIAVFMLNYIQDICVEIMAWISSKGTIAATSQNDASH
jgi:hypothetical protein